MVLLHIFQGGGSNFFQGGGGGSGVQMLISIETHITCLDPLSPSRSANVRCGILARIGSDEPVRPPFKRLAKALISLRTCAGWSKPLVLAHTTLLEISYFGPFIGAKNALRLYIRTKLHLSDKEPVTSFIKNM